MRDFREKNQSARDPQSGNVMFYIIAAIALLAALSYAVAQGGRGGVQSLSQDRAKLFASEVIAYGDAVAKSAQALRLRGVPPEMLNFDTPLLTGYANGACGAEASCALYNPMGGAVNYTRPARDWLQGDFSGQAEFENAYISGAVCVPEVGLGGGDCATDSTDNEELVFFVPFLKPEVCMAINRLLQVDNPGGDAPAQGDCAWASKFTGAFAAGQVISAPGMTGKSAGCVKVDSGCAAAPDSYHFYQVLIAR